MQAPPEGHSNSPSPERRKQLRKAAKQELERRFNVVNDAINEAVPLHSSNDPTWGKRFKLGVERERWLRGTLPLLHKPELDKLFVVMEDPHPLSSYVGGYMRCRGCESVAPTALPREKRFYWKSCKCKNIRWRVLLWWGACKVRRPELLEPIRLLGRGQ